MTNHHYSMEIHWSDEDQIFLVTLPEFPNCKTHGSSYTEAVKSGEEVLELLISDYKAQGKPLPQPLTVSTKA